MKTHRRMFHFYLVTMLLLAGLLAPPSTMSASDEDRGDDYVPGEIVVKLFSAADLAAVAADYGLAAEPLNQFGSRPIYVLRILDGEEPPKKADAMANDSRIEYVEPNHSYSAPEGQKRSSWARVEDVADYAEQWAADKIGLPAAQRVTRGAGVIVAVLDTGIDASHPALAGKLTQGYDFVDMDADPSEVGNVEDDPVYGHGTHVAGIVALTAPGAKIMPLRVLDRNGEGNVWVLAEALSYAVNPDGDLATDDGATVINLSLSTTWRTEFLDDIIDSITCTTDGDADDDDDDGGDGGDGGEDDGAENDAGSAGAAAGRHDEDCLSRQGAVIVAAAGNNGSSVKEYPAAEGNKALLAVAATTAVDVLADYSNYGSWVSLGAPGDMILSTVPDNQWGAWSGTSMAAPFVAGVAALVRANAADLVPEEVARRIVTTGAAIEGDVRVRVDAAAALGVPPDTSAPPVLFLPWLRVDSAP